MTQKIDLSRAAQAGSVSAALLSAGAKQSVLQSKLLAARKGVLGFSSGTGSSADVSTEVLAAASTDTPQTALTAKGIYVGAVADAADVKKVLIRHAGTDNGVEDGEGDEIYGVLTEDTGDYTLSFKQSDGGDYTFGSDTPIDFYFVEVFDADDLPSSALLYQAIAGVVDAGQATTLAGHLNGGASKHDASEIDFELTDGSKQVIQASSDDVEAALVDLDLYLGNHVALSGVAKTAVNLGTFTGSTIADNQTIKAALQALETAVEAKAESSVVSEIDQNVDDLISLSGVAENAVNLGTFTGSTIADNQTIKAALQALETAVEAAQSDATQALSDAAAAQSAADDAQEDVDDLVALSGVAANAVNLGTFTGSTIPDSQTVKQAFQALETAVEAISSESLQREVFTLDSTDITNKYVDLAAVPATAAAVQLFFVSIGNVKQRYSLDFTIKSDGSENKRLSWATADVTPGMEADLIDGDILEAYYTV